MGTFDDYSPDDLGKTITKYQWVLFIVNVVALLASVATFGVCLWIRFVITSLSWQG